MILTLPLLPQLLPKVLPSRPLSLLPLHRLMLPSRPLKQQLLPLLMPLPHRPSEAKAPMTFPSKSSMEIPF